MRVPKARRSPNSERRDPTIKASDEERKDASYELLSTTEYWKIITDTTLLYQMWHNAQISGFNLALVLVQDLQRVISLTYTYCTSVRTASVHICAYNFRNFDELGYKRRLIFLLTKELRNCHICRIVRRNTTAQILLTIRKNSLFPCKCNKVLVIFCSYSSDYNNTSKIFLMFEAAPALDIKL